MESDTIGLLILLGLIALPLLIFAITMDVRSRHRKTASSLQPISSEALRTLTVRVDRERQLDPHKQSF